jgi:hypothetical protein
MINSDRQRVHSHAKRHGEIGAVAMTTDALQPILDFLTKTTKVTPSINIYGPEKRQIRVATLNDYPATGVTTFVTIGASQLPVTMYRGLDVGFELTLTLVKPDPHAAEDLAKAVMENLRVAESGLRRPFIEYNGIHAPGYPPHLLFTEQVTCTPKLSGRKRCGDRWISFLAAIPLDDNELREYDRGVANLIAKLKEDGRLDTYPRR